MKPRTSNIFEFQILIFNWLFKSLNSSFEAFWIRIFKTISNFKIQKFASIKSKFQVAHLNLIFVKNFELKFLNFFWILKSKLTTLKSKLKILNYEFWTQILKFFLNFFNWNLQVLRVWSCKFGFVIFEKFQTFLFAIWKVSLKLKTSNLTFTSFK